MNKMVKMLVLAAVGAVASLAQAQEGIANNSELAQVLVKPPAYKITYANTKTIVTNDWMVFVWVKRGAEFEGLKSDCTAVNTNTSIVLDKFRIKNGTFDAFTAAWPRTRWDYRMGDIRLLLLDTRLFQADEDYRASSGTSLVANQTMTIQAYGSAGYVSMSVDGKLPEVTTNAAGKAIAPWADVPDYQASEIPDDTPLPVMTDFYKNSNTSYSSKETSGSGWNKTTYYIYSPTVTIKATNTVATLNYVIERSTDPNFSNDVVIASSPITGLSDPNQELTFTANAPKYYKKNGTSSRYSAYVYDESATGTSRFTSTTYDTSTTYYYRVVRYVETTNSDGTTTQENKGYSGVNEVSLTDDDSSSSSSGSSIFDNLFGF